MKTVIAGSRSIVDPQILEEAIRLSGYVITEVVCGMARGVDQLGWDWGIQNFVPIRFFPAEWNKYGRSAGYRRNVEMAKYCDQGIIVWDGKSSGTKHMMQSLRADKKPYFLFLFGDDQQLLEFDN